MKKNFLRVLALLCAMMLMLAVFAGCDNTQPSGETTDSTSESTNPSDPGTQGGEENTALNAYIATYDEVVELLVTEGAIADASAAVDMNTTAGYWFDNMTGAQSTEAIAAADVAKDFGGVYLVWFDIDGDYMASWANMKFNGPVLLYQGGMCMLQMDSNKGMFVLGFGTDVSEDVKSKAKAAFDKLDTTVPEDANYMTAAADLALALKDKGYIAAADIASSEDLNNKYYVEGPGEEWDDATGDYVSVDNYKYYAEFASEAKSFGGITIFYYNTLDGYSFLEENLSFSGAGLAYKGLQENNVITAYVGDMNWVYTPYLENGAEVSYTADVVCGRFAVSIDDSVANKAEIVSYLESLVK